MKVMVGEFVTESNANVPTKCILDNYDIGFGSDCINKMRIKEVFEKNEVELIPSIFANAGPAGVITRPTFDYLESVFLDTVKENINELDGIFLMLHGASEVEEIGSGDHHILKEIRKIVGPYLPIAVVCDPHGNLCKEYVESIQILRSYRESPHTDADETMVKVAQMLCDLLNNRQNIHSVYRKLPLILGGEQSVSTDEPVQSINRYMDELEKDERIKSASWHVGYIRHDSDVAGCGIVVVPEKESDLLYANQVADELARYVWDKRNEFHYTGLTMKPEEALKTALEFEEKPVFITDSGDNVTSGAGGWNTYILRQVLQEKNHDKSFLFATICDPNAFDVLKNKKIGEEVHIQLGYNVDDLSSPVQLDVNVRSKGNLMGFMMHDHHTVFGQTINVKIKDLPIVIMVASTNWAVCEKHQFISAGINWDEYDIIVVKEGYIFPELKEKGKLSIMSLTQGATLQDTSQLPFKRIMRPMYPIDEI
ncbi:M81 family metallopeptidase [Dubosiella newyorkensis]|jgi:microcystin degradation protein MlrC|uniref:M81 family metallopeptidase n=2 Tax=Dubosiella newyorkensis TaxID=1862672 RepID=UPI002357E601|nr:M81 family metallopeptidase [Dubosiella newyorkensis]MCI9042169.1 M81 family metallopeptidase [Dubosiella newyorkensis]